MSIRADDLGFLESWAHGWSCGDPEELLPFYAPHAVYTDVTSGLTCKVPGVAFCTLTPDGHIAVHEDYWDMATLLRQLGFGPDGSAEPG